MLVLIEENQLALLLKVLFCFFEGYALLMKMFSVFYFIFSLFIRKLPTCFDVFIVSCT